MQTAGAHAGRPPTPTPLLAQPLSRRRALESSAAGSAARDKLVGRPLPTCGLRLSACDALPAQMHPSPRKGMWAFPRSGGGESCGGLCTPLRTYPQLRKSFDAKDLCMRFSRPTWCASCHGAVDASCPPRQFSKPHRIQACGVHGDLDDGRSIEEVSLMSATRILCFCIGLMALGSAAIVLEGCGGGSSTPPGPAARNHRG